jgi:Ca2+-binding EF-hand superfamily protein
MANHLNTHSLPLLPGNTFSDPTKSRYHVSQSLGFKNGFALKDKPSCGIGGEALHINPLNDADLFELANFKPTLTYGQAKQAPPEEFIPSHVAFDKKVLLFHAYFKQTVYESQSEYFRVRPVKIYYYLEDDTIAVSEPSVENSGMPQGKLIRRQRLPKDDATGQHYNYKDIKIDGTVTFYGKVFHVVDCDAWSREYLTSQGLVVNDAVEVPADNYNEDRKRRNAAKTFTTKSDFDKLKQFLALDRKVLRFFCVWDDRDKMFGEVRPFVIHYYLVDDTVEIRECHKNNDGRDPFPLLMSRTKLPKNLYDVPPSFPTISMEARETEHTDYFTPEDFMINNTVTMMNRRFLIYDMDNFTKEFYRYNYGIKNFDPVPVEGPARDAPQMYIPPYNGFGSLEDSLGSCFKLEPEPPRKDFIKMLSNDHKNLRFLAELDENDDGADCERRFIINFSLATDTFMIYEKPARNCGRKTGKFLERTRIPKPGCDINHPEFYGPQDLTIGNVVYVFNRRFKIVDADVFVLTYLKENAFRFPGIERTINSLQTLHESHQLGQQLPIEYTSEEKEALIQRLGAQLRRAHFNRFSSIREAFLKLDANRDKYIQPQELKHYVHNLNIPIDDTIIHEIFNIIDTNHDGNISWEEFIEFIEQAATC